jgi:uncharacterized membrane protein YbhN (UPF0104 family)
MNLELLRSPRVGAAFLVLALAALAWAVARSWPELAAAIGALREAKLLALTALAAYIGFVLVLGLAWRGLLVRCGGARLGLGTMLRVQSIAWSARYIPGKLGLVAAKVLLVPGARASAVWAAGWEQALFLVAGAVLIAACAAVAAGSAVGVLLPGAAPLAVIVLAAMLLIVAAACAPQLDRVVVRLSGGAAGTLHPGVGELAAWLLAFAAAHVLVGLGFVALLAALGHGTAFSPVEAVGILTAAHLGGIVAVVAPAGLGVREALLAGLLAPTLGVEAALAVALVTRAGATIGDVLIAPLALLPAPRGPA